MKIALGDRDDEAGKLSDAETMTAPYETYRQLIARVEAFGQAIRERYAAQLTCHAGCDHCCYQDFTVFPVEAHHLAQAIAALTPEARQRLQQRLQQADNPMAMADAPQPCVLLHEGHCQVYDGRPLICRIQGFPLFSTMIEHPDGSQRDCCPLNFSTLALSEVESTAIYNLDLVNQTLAAINHLYLHETGQPEARVSLRQAVRDALDPFCDEADASS
jgi:Fe-S-cluster containining protein